VSDVSVNVASGLVGNGSSILMRSALKLAPHVVRHLGPWVRQTGLSPGQSYRDRAARNGSGSFCGLCGPLIAAAELADVIDAKPGLLRVQIDICPIYTVNFCKCTRRRGAEV